jgi:HD-GYP domain-containing protein (c-di-GMP phosphodiesterase class II)
VLSGINRANDNEYSKFSVDKLIDNSITDFDLFINLDSHFILYSGNGYRWNRDELTDLLASGHAEFFVRQEEIPKAKMYESLAQLPAVKKNQPPFERIQSIEQVGAKFIQCLYEGEITEACISKAEDLGDSIVDCMQEDKSCIKYISGLAGHDYYTYYHSIRVASYATAIAIEMGLKEKEQIKNIALGGIFHDIGKKVIPLNILNKAGPLNEGEWRAMKAHPEQGSLQVSDTFLPLVPNEIILHHHERRGGGGYPHGLDKRSLLPEVQIAAMADIFDALTSSRTYQNRRSRFEALDFIKHKLLDKEVCPEAYKALILCLAS